jgi:hypothetical protein
MGATGRKSKVGLVIGLAAVVVGGAVLAIVLVMRGGKGGSSTRDGAINDAFAALSAGDGDKLVKLGNFADLISTVIECKEPDDDQDTKKKHDLDDEDFDMHHPEKMVDKIKKTTTRVADAVKGTQIEVVSIDTDPMPALEPDDDKADKDDDDSSTKRRHKRDHDDDTHTHIQHKGDKVGDGCKFKKTFQSQSVSVRVKVTEPDRDPDKQKVDVEVTEIDGRYYITELPKLKLIGATLKMAGFVRDDMCACSDSKCADKVERDYRSVERLGRDLKDKLTKDDKDKGKAIDKEYKSCRKKATGKGGPDSDDMLAKMTEFTDHMCKCTDKACADRVNDEMMKWSTDMAKNATDNVPDVPDADTTRKMTDVMKRMTDCMTKAMTAQIDPPPPPPPPPPVQIEFQPAPSDMPQTCQDFRAELQRIAACDKFPAAAKDSLRQSWDALVGAWGSTPTGARNAMGDTCKSSLDAIKQSASTLCP